MSIFGFSSKKEVQEKEQQARAEGRSIGERSVLQNQQSNLSNLAKGSQIKFAVPFFDVFDPRFENFAVPIAVHGTVVYCVEDIGKFRSINKTQNVNDGVFEQKMRGQLAKYIKSVITNAPMDNQIPVLQMERKIIELSELVQRLVSPKIEQLFGVNIRSLDITEIIVDKESCGYGDLKAVTTDLERQGLEQRQSIFLRQQELAIGGQEELQRMQLENQRETMRIQREELQRAARLQTETNFLSAHQANLNAEVGKSGGGLLNGRASSMSRMPAMPDATPQVQYMVGVNGQQMGPCDWNQLRQLVQQGKLTHQTYVWKQGMAQWQFAGEVPELTVLFADSGMLVPPELPNM